MNTHINLLDGSPFDYMDINRYPVNPKTLCEALENVFRYGGHTSKETRISVAKHSYLVGRLCEEFGRPDFATFAYLHDLHESVFGDQMTPFKNSWPESFRRYYNNQTEQLDIHIMKRLGTYNYFRIYKNDIKKMVKTYDKMALALESLWTGKDMYRIFEYEDLSDADKQKARDIAFDVFKDHQINGEALYNKIIESIPNEDSNS